ncbi:MAG: hypothetical protein ABII12_03390 [Planctomycetota bacterium]
MRTRVLARGGVLVICVVAVWGILGGGCGVGPDADGDSDGMGDACEVVDTADGAGSSWTDRGYSDPLACARGSDQVADMGEITVHFADSRTA